MKKTASDACCISASAARAFLRANGLARPSRPCLRLFPSLVWSRRRQSMSLRCRPFPGAAAQDFPIGIRHSPDGIRALWLDQGLPVPQPVELSLRFFRLSPSSFAAAARPHRSLRRSFPLLPRRSALCYNPLEN